jgi:hypothetical protein
MMEAVGRENLKSLKQREVFFPTHCEYNERTINKSISPRPLAASLRVQYRTCFVVCTKEVEILTSEFLFAFLFNFSCSEFSGAPNNCSFLLQFCKETDGPQTFAVLSTEHEPLHTTTRV